MTVSLFYFLLERDRFLKRSFYLFFDNLIKKQVKIYSKKMRFLSSDRLYLGSK